MKIRKKSVVKRPKQYVNPKADQYKIRERLALSLLGVDARPDYRRSAAVVRGRSDTLPVYRRRLVTDYRVVLLFWGSS
jgi:hypothetical protein